MKKQFYSNGKLLLTGEYVVLDGVTALAIPTKFGQSLNVSEKENASLVWKSYTNENEVWFEGAFNLGADISVEKSTDSKVAGTLTKILEVARQLNPAFLKQGATVEAKLEFPQHWGLGSSSTLINNIAQWANVDAFVLLEKSFGGSGYDIAAAQHDSPIFYTKTIPPTIQEIGLPWDFKDQLFFVYLNQKMDSKKGIASYRKKEVDKTIIHRISDISKKLLACYTLQQFQQLLEAHEQFISEIIEQPTVKDNLFPDYPNTIKSLGAWGGDFVLATGSKEDQSYFIDKGYATIISFEEMIK